MNELQILATEAAACTKCPELVQSRTQVVLWEGNPTTQIMIIGESAGQEEDKNGKPFCGRSGELLTNILKACNINREDVLITNTILCHPPKNRNPTPIEAANCRHFLDEQINIIKPKYIICLGAVAAQNLLNTEDKISSLRGRWHDYKGIKVLATYHPSFLLRTGDRSKQAVWDDLQLLLQEMKNG